jgi:hypothetical protein
MNRDEGYYDGATREVTAASLLKYKHFPTPVFGWRRYSVWATAFTTEEAGFDLRQGETFFLLRTDHVGSGAHPAFCRMCF